MNAQSLYTLFVLLLWRNLLGTGVRRTIVFAVSLLSVLPLMHAGNALWYAAVVAASVGADALSGRSRGRRDELRICSLAATAAAVLIPLNLAGFDAGLSAFADAAWRELRAAAPLLSALDADRLRRALAVAVGLLVAAFESNYVVLAVLRKYKMIPGSGLRPTAAGLGRLIGILERTLLFILIVTGNLGAIGFVVAAKALARHKELEQKEFAEYFLVGTLLSVLCSMAAGFAVRALL
jgi:hypothetical protein